MKEAIKRRFPLIAGEVEYWYPFELRSAAILGAFDRVYGEYHPDRRELIFMLFSDPDPLQKTHGPYLHHLTDK